MLKRSVYLACILCVSPLVYAQEAASGISVPVAISGVARSEPGESPVTAGFRAVVSPTLKLGPHWFFYSAIEARSSDYFDYKTGASNGRAVDARILQAFAGYETRLGRVSLLLKAGEMTSAFGLFPSEYRDQDMPLIDAPPPYVATLPLRPDQQPCGLWDLAAQEYDSPISFRCGGSATAAYGLVPVSLYAIPAAEADISISRFDARVQLTNSSPSNPQPLASRSQYPQWTMGAGYTFPGGLRIGASGFRGPYLDRSLAQFAFPAKPVRSFQASGLGLEVTWARGPWAMEGEWMHFRFELPNFVISPSESAAYAQVKRIVSPRVFVAARASVSHPNDVIDAAGIAGAFAARQQSYEVGAGYRLSRVQLLKAGFTWVHGSPWSAGNWFWSPEDHTRFEVQLVTSFPAISKSFR